MFFVIVGGACAFATCVSVDTWNINYTFTNAIYISFFFFSFSLSVQFSDCDIHEFDKQWYESTIVSQEDWVCSKDLYQTNAFALNRIGEVIGCLFLSPLGDK